MKTDLEKMKEMLSKAKIIFDVDEDGDLAIRGGMGQNNCGDPSVRCFLNFDSKGNLLNIGLWK